MINKSQPTKPTESIVFDLYVYLNFYRDFP